MQLYTTTIKAVVNGEVKSFCGPHIQGISPKDAQDYCENNGLGYCTVTGMLVSEIPCKEGTNTADIIERVDYDIIWLN